MAPFSMHSLKLNYLGITHQNNNILIRTFYVREKKKLKSLCKEKN